MTRLRALILGLGLAIAGLSLLPSGAGAAKVANPGSFTMELTGGSFRVKTTSFDLAEVDPNPTLTGTIDAAGNVNIPAANINFDPLFVDLDGDEITVRLQPTQAWTGTFDPHTGAFNLRVRLRIKLEGNPQGISLGGSCYIGNTNNLDLNMATTGTTSPPGPNTPISGTPYDFSAGTVTIVNNSYSVPGAEGCGPFGLANGPINDALGLPSAAGNNDIFLGFTFTANKPIPAIRPSFTATPNSGDAPLPVVFNATATQSSQAVQGYDWDFDGNGTYDQTTLVPTTSFIYNTPGTYQAKLRVRDVQGDSNTTTRTVTVTQAPVDLAITKTHTGNFRVGTNNSYTLDVDNQGGPFTGDITVTDTLPAGLTFISATGTLWNCNAVGQNVTCTNPGGLAAFVDPADITLNVGVGAAALPSVTNTATVSVTGETDPGDNSDDDPTTVTGIDLSIDKSHTGNFPVSDPGVYTLNVTNQGTADTIGTTTVTDTLPPELTYVSGTGSGWSCNAAGQDVTCTYAGTIAAGASVPITLTVSAAITGGGLSQTVTNSATVATQDDYNPANNSDSDETLLLDAPDAAIDKSHVGATFTAGSTETFLIDVRNDGSQTTTGTTTVTDTLPAGVTYVSGTGTGWVCNAVGQDVTCDYADPIADGAAAPQITLVVDIGVDAIPEVSNTAVVTTPDDGNAANDSDTDTVEVRQIDLSLDKEAVGVFRVNRNATYTLTVSNGGNSSTAGPATVTDTLPAGVTFVAASGDGWSCGAAGQLVTCTYADPIPGAASAPAIELIVALDSAAIPSVSNTATVATVDDLITANDSDTETSDVVSQDVAIDKTHTGGDFTVGTTRTYTLSVDNVGSVATSSDIVVTDVLPAGLSFVSASGLNWSCGESAGTVTCTRTASLAPESPASDIQLRVSVGAAAAGGVDNTASVSTGGDLNTANDSDTDSSGVTAPDLAIDASHTGDLRAGSNATLSVDVSNGGDAPTYGTTTVVDTLPAGYGFVSASGSGWDCAQAAGTVTCDRDADIAAGGAAPTITIIVSVPLSASASASNDATVSAAGDSDGSNDSDSDPLTIRSFDANLSITGDSAADVGEDIDYEIDVANSGDAASDSTVVVTDTLPTGIIPLDASGTDWLCDITGQTVTCEYNGLAAGGSAPTISIRARATSAAASTVTNTATVSNGDDVDTSDNSDSVDTDITPVIDVALDMELRNPIASGFRVGTDGTYRFTVTNTGGVPTSAPTTLTVTLPNGFTQKPVTDPDWSCAPSGQQVNCTRAAALGNGASDFVDISFAVTNSAAAEVTTNAQLNTAGDANSSNDTDSDTVNVRRIDLRIDKAHSSNWAAGGTGTFTVDVANIGTAGTIAPATVTDTLPAGVTYNGSTGAGWACSASLQTVSCTRSALIPAGGAATQLTISVSVADAAVPSATSAASVSTQDDVNAANNTDSDTIPVAAKPLFVPQAKAPVIVSTEAIPTLTGQLTILVSCPADATERCKGTLKLTYTAKAGTTGSARNAAAAKKRRTLTGMLGPVTYDIAAGRTAPVVLQMTPRLVRQLGGKIVPGTATATPSNPGIPPVIQGMAINEKGLPGEKKPPKKKGTK